jgi:hypothetical protein
MDHAFEGLIGKIIAIYQDDLTVFSKDRGDHIKHLRRIFERCRKFGISLNPKKSTFGVDEGKLLGHIVSKEGIRIDPERVQGIQAITPPKDVSSLRSFFGKINFVRRFIPNLAELAKPLNSLLKKDVKFIWDKKCDASFESLKKAIASAPVLVSPNYNKEFLIYSYASEDTIAGVLLQKNEENHEQPVAFMSKNLRDAELNYTTTEKQAYALVKSLKHFRTYIGYSKIMAYVPYQAVKDVLSQPDGIGVRGNWISRIQEYDIEIKPVKIVKGQGLAQLLTDSKLQQNNMILYIDEDHEWYKDIIFYLRHMTCPDHLVDHQRRALRLRASKYVLTEDGLGWKNPDGIILKCVNHDDSQRIIKEMHSGLCGGHYAPRTTAAKIMRAGYYWPSLFKDVHIFVRACQECQFYSGKPRLPALPLTPVIIEEPFQQWGMDFVGPINPSSSSGHKYILTCTDYFTRWVEAIPTKKCTAEVVVKFLEENIVSRYGCPYKITTDNAPAFSKIEMSTFCADHGITLSHSSNYYPQGNGLAESSNKNLIRLLKRMIGENKRTWDVKLKYALWADRTTVKRITGKAPFEIVYGQNCRLPINLQIPVYELLQQCSSDQEALQARIDRLVELDETRREAWNKMVLEQERIKGTFDQKSRDVIFGVGDIVLLWDKHKEKPGNHEKFERIWMGPYRVSRMAGKGTVYLETLDGDELELPVNGRLLKHYFPPISLE